MKKTLKSFAQYFCYLFTLNYVGSIIFINFESHPIHRSNLDFFTTSLFFAALIMLYEKYGRSKKGDTKENTL